MQIELLIGGHSPCLASPKDGLKVEWARKGQPGQLSFEIPKEGTRIAPGDPVILSKDGARVFAGYCFRVAESGDDFLKVTCYDQLRYLTKNKDTYVYKNKTASQLIHMIAADFHLQVGHLSPTGYVIPRRIEDNTALYDMINNALLETLGHTKELFVFYDEAGALTLRHLSEMHVGALVLESNSQDYTYERSIDGNTHNKIKLVRENKEKGKREVFIAQDSGNMSRWGILQYFEKINVDDEAAKQKVHALLDLYNKEEERLQVKGVEGDFQVRGGSLLSVHVAGISARLMVDRVSHHVENAYHSMDLTLQGGGFVV